MVWGYARAADVASLAGLTAKAVAEGVTIRTGVRVTGVDVGGGAVTAVGLGLLSAVPLFGSATLVPLVIDHAGPIGLLGLVGWLMWVAWVVVYGISLARPAPDRHHGRVAA